MFYSIVDRVVKLVNWWLCCTFSLVVGWFSGIGFGYCVVPLWSVIKFTYGVMCSILPCFKYHHSTHWVGCGRKMGLSTVYTCRTLHETRMVMMMSWQHWCIVPQCDSLFVLSCLRSYSVLRPDQSRIYRSDSDLMHATNILMLGLERTLIKK